MTVKAEVQEALAEMFQKSVSTTMTAPKLHGMGGLFSNSIERDVISAMVRPRGLSKVLPVLPSVYEDPRFASITGFTAVYGSEPENACEDAPAGYMKGCNLTARFGMIRRDTNTIEMDKVMLKINRGDFTDIMLRGKLLGEDNLIPSGMNEADVLNIITKAEMVGASVQAERKISQDIWQGTIAAGTFPGLDVQIATGQKDADTATLCPALDSDIKDFNYDLVGGSGRDIVEYLSSMEFYIRTNAETMGLDPATWVFAMRPELWFELSAVWPCSYLSHRCNAGDTNISVINDNVNVAMRDNMRNGAFITINGNNYPVIADTGIYEHNNINTAGLAAGEYASSIYMIPLTITGGFPVTYLEHVDYRKALPDTALLQGHEVFWSDDGRFAWAVTNDKWCYKLSLKIEPRIVLRTPQLAGKLQHVKYTPLQHLRDPYPESPYFANGGVSMRADNFGYAVWDGR